MSTAISGADEDQLVRNISRGNTMTYYQIYYLEDHQWVAGFGDHNKSEVKAEADNYHYCDGIRRKDMKITTYDHAPSYFEILTETAVLNKTAEYIAAKPIFH